MGPVMNDFWRDSGYRLLAVGDDGRLRVTDDFLRAYLLRPEVRPVAESCAAERALHEDLMAEPRSVVDEARLAALADADARDNYRVVLAFRDRLVAAGTLEGNGKMRFTDSVSSSTRQLPARLVTNPWRNCWIEPSPDAAWLESKGV